MGKIADKVAVEFINRVRKKYNVKKAILFGSRARGDNFKDSDYDILIVSPDFKGIFFSQRIARMYDFWDKLPTEVEPFCYTPEEFEIKSNQIGLVSQAVKEGIEI
ncbi:MAG: nucleotidyltransferase domain-containing protein [archaeon]